MTELLSVPSPNEWTDGDIKMSAVEAFAGVLFEVADNDSAYHHKPQDVKDRLIHGQCQCSCEDVAESILAWWGEL